MIAPLVLGFFFGAMLQRAGLSRYDRIVNVYRFTDLAVLKFLLSALVTAAIGIRLLQAAGLATAVPIPVTYVWGNLVGGVIFGIGMASSGFCPGTVAAGAGEGRLDYLIPGGLGLVTGAVVYGVAYDRVMPALTRAGALGPTTLAELLGVEPWIVVVVFAELVLVLFYALERVRPGRRRHSAAVSWTKSRSTSM